MGSRIADRMALAASRSFVGREVELTRLRNAMEGEGRPAVVFIHGPGGIGKSRLLDSAARLSWPQAKTVRLDCEGVEPTPGGFGRALSTALAETDDEGRADFQEAIEEVEGPVVLALDTYECFGLIDSWLRCDFIPSLPGDWLVVVAGRSRPSPAWLSGPWATLVDAIELGPLSPHESLAMLATRGLGPSEAEAVERFANGHPLAADLAAAAVRSGAEVNLDTEPPAGVFEGLVEAFLRGADEGLRRGVEAASVARRVTAPILDALLPEDDGLRLYGRLRELVFVTPSADGLVLHALVRDAVRAELGRRDPVLRASLRQAAARAAASEEPIGARGRWHQTADLLYLIEHPIVRGCYFPPEEGVSAVEPATAADRNTVLEITEAWDGAGAGLEQVTHWWDAVPESFSVVRDASGAPIAFSSLAEIGEVPAALLAHDPVAAACAADLESRPLGEDAAVLLIRRSLSRASGETPGRELAGLWIDCKRLYFELRPRLRRAYIVFEDVQGVGPLLAPLGFSRAVDDIAVGRKRFGVLGLDFGPRSVDGWLEQLIDIELEAAKGATVDPGTDREADAVAGLTPREREVLVLVADGLTNRLIAERLVVSEKTAARHVANVFLKLGVHSRAHAARIAAESGLTRAAVAAGAPIT